MFPFHRAANAAPLRALWAFANLSVRQVNGCLGRSGGLWKGSSGPHHVAVKDSLQCLRPLANRERPSPGARVAGDGQKLAGSTGNIDFQPLRCVHSVIAALVVGKTGGFEEYPYPLSAGAGFCVACHCGSNIHGKRGGGAVLRYAVVNVNGT